MQARRRHGRKLGRGAECPFLQAAFRGRERAPDASRPSGVNAGLHGIGSAKGRPVWAAGAPVRRCAGAPGRRGAGDDAGAEFVSRRLPQKRSTQKR